MVNAKSASGKGILIIMAMAALPLLASCGQTGPVGVSSASSTSHNPGADCTACHAVAYAGTVYAAAGSLVPVMGAQVTVTEASGTIINMFTDRAGNFWSQGGSPSAGYTTTLAGSLLQMIRPATTGACSMGGCHDGTAVQRVYLTR